MRVLSQTLHCGISKNFQVMCFRKEPEYGGKFRKHPSLGFSKNVKEYLLNKDFENTVLWKFFREDKNLSDLEIFTNTGDFKKYVFRKFLYKNFEILQTYVSLWYYVFQVMRPVANDVFQWLETNYTIKYCDFEKFSRTSSR